ncbi:MAG TPA: hypothetical protein VFB33_13785 [Candidatus Binataceae bacterium]|jgi:hypothetical protein|nr:hypothetical protein [Candidatus Binataceae bacterium]
MLDLRSTMKFAATAGFTFAIMAFAFVPKAAAQAMGEYGGAVGNAAVSTGAAPSIAPDVGFKVSTESAGSSGPTQTVEVREDDSDEAARPRRRRHARHTDSDDAGPDGDWVQVK